MSSQPRTTPARAALAAFALVTAAVLFLIFGGSRADSGGAPAVSATGKWTCSMCPQFVLPEPGKCPKCFMDLIPLQEGAASGGKLELVLSDPAAALAGITTAVLEPETSDGERDGVTVPHTAVLHSLGRHFVYVESHDGENATYTLREVALGARRGDGWAVASGLDAGDAVAVSGLYRIDSAMQILGKVCLANIPDGDLASVLDDEMEPYQPAEPSALDIRGEGLAVDGWFEKYEAVRAALATDTAGQEAARALRAMLADQPKTAPEEFADLFAGLSTHSSLLADAGDLERRRAAFEKLTADMVLLARRYGPPAGGLNLVFCPMAFGGTGAYWLQPGETVDNPYHGLEMPLCGWLVENIPGTNAE